MSDCTCPFCQQYIVGDTSCQQCGNPLPEPHNSHYGLYSVNGQLRRLCVQCYKMLSATKGTKIELTKLVPRRNT